MKQFKTPVLILLYLLWSANAFALESITGEISLNKEAYMPYEPIILTVRLTNNTNSPIMMPIYAVNAGGNRLCFSVEAHDKYSDKLVSAITVGGNEFLPFQNSHVFKLEPGMHVQRSVDISSLSHNGRFVSHPGHYTLQARWQYSKFQKKEKYLSQYHEFFEKARENNDAELILFEDIISNQVIFEITHPSWLENESLIKPIKRLTRTRRTIFLHSSLSRIKSFVNSCTKDNSEIPEIFAKYYLFNFITNKKGNRKYGYEGLYYKYCYKYPAKSVGERMTQDDLKQLKEYFNDLEGAEPFQDELERLEIFSLYCHDREKAREALKKYMEKFPGRYFPFLEKASLAASEGQHNAYQHYERERNRAALEAKKNRNQETKAKPENSDQTPGKFNQTNKSDLTGNNRTKNKPFQENQNTSTKNDSNSSIWDDKRVLLIGIIIVILISFVLLVKKISRKRN